MIAVDHHPRTAGSAEGRQLLDPIEDAPAAEQHLADEDEVVRAGLRRVEETLGKTVERLNGNSLDDSRARFLPPGELPAGTVELAVAGQHANGPVPGAGGEQADQQLVSIWREHDGVGLTRSELSRDLGLRGGPHLAHHLVPFEVGEQGRILPRLHVTIEARVGPEVMAMGREMQPLRIRAEAPAEQVLEAQRCVLSAQSSGKTRLSSVDRR